MSSLLQHRYLQSKYLRRYRRPNLILRFTTLLAAVLLPYSLASNESQNGISAGQPKVFDNRSLESVVEHFEQSLRSTQFVNKSDLAGAIGTYQGSRVSDTSRSLEITSLPTPVTDFRSLQMLAVVSSA